MCSNKNNYVTVSLPKSHLIERFSPLPRGTRFEPDTKKIIIIVLLKDVYNM